MNIKFSELINFKSVFDRTIKTLDALSIYLWIVLGVLWLVG